MGRRVESPSSINTYNQCPRRYYYRYIAKLPSKGSFATVRGKVAHSVLEDFYDIDITTLDKFKFYDEFRLYAINLYHKHWQNAIPQFLELGVDKDKVLFLYTETLEMIENFLYRFCTKLDKQMKSSSLSDAFESLKPIREQRYFSKKYQVQGFIDAISEDDGVVTLWDYKTSKRAKFSPEYKLQLGIYAIMYEEKHGKLPEKVGIDFLKFCEMVLPVDEALVKEAKLQCELIHLNTESGSIEEYQKKPGPLCKWRTGQCDYYDKCFGVKSLHDF